MAKPRQQQPKQPVRDLGLDGMAAHQRGDLAKAEEFYIKALTLNPRTLTALNGLGVLRASEKKFSEAADLFRRAHAVDANVPEFRQNLGSACFEHARLCEREEKKEEAIKYYWEALAHMQGHVESLTNLGELLRDKRELPEAEKLLEEALRQRPDHYGVVNNMGMLRQTQNRLPEAADLFRRVAALNPGFVKGHGNLGVVLQDMEDFEGAIAAYDAALKLDPGDLLTLYNRALCLLTFGRLAEGWDTWIARHKLKNKRNFPQPLWDGTPLKGKRVVLWGDQGIGEDIITFSTIDDLLAQGAQVMAEMSERLIPICKRSYPQVDCVVKPPMPDPEHIRDDLTDKRALDPAIDFQCPTFWPAIHLRRSFDAFPVSRRAFLKADAEKTASIRARYEALGKKRIIGIAWRSGAKLGKYKSSPLAEWLPLLQTPDTAFIDLQYGDTAAERAAFAAAHSGITLFHDDAVDQARNLDDFAAQIMACDCIVSISNTTVHMAGALGKECHLMLPRGLGSLWYWFRDRADNPWYPCIKIYRQSAVGNWGDVVADVAKALG